MLYKLSVLTQPQPGIELNNQRYQFRISGLNQPAGHIKTSQLFRVLRTLTTAAGHATRLRATGDGNIKGKKPKWLTETTDFTVTGLDSGSTTLSIDAPRLRDTAYAEFGQQKLFDEQPNLDDTALDIVSAAIHEMQSEDSAGNYFDNSVLNAVLKFKTVAGASIRYQLIPQQSRHLGFRLDEHLYEEISKRISDTPPPQSYIVSGVLNQIKHADGGFCLSIGNKRLLGKLDRQALDIEELRHLWGKRTTVAGLIHYKINGQARLIEAQRIGAQLEGDQVFKKTPSQGSRNSLDFLVASGIKHSIPPADPMALWGAWPGDESIEEILSQLD